MNLKKKILNINILINEKKENNHKFTNNSYIK